MKVGICLATTEFIARVLFLENFAAWGKLTGYLDPDRGFLRDT
jgi:hypothetical protein